TVLVSNPRVQICPQPDGHARRLTRPSGACWLSRERVPRESSHVFMREGTMSESCPEFVFCRRIGTCEEDRGRSQTKGTVAEGLHGRPNRKKHQQHNRQEAKPSKAPRSRSQLAETDAPAALRTCPRINRVVAARTVPRRMIVC